MSPPAARSSSIAGKPAPPAVEVRSGDWVKRVTPKSADVMVVRGWAEWIGTGRRRHLRLTESAPISSLLGRADHDGTRPMRADQTCQVYSDGQAMGDGRKLREFIPR